MTFLFVYMWPFCVVITFSLFVVWHICLWLWINYQLFKWFFPCSNSCFPCLWPTHVCVLEIINNCSHELFPYSNNMLPCLWLGSYLYFRINYQLFKWHFFLLICEFSLFTSPFYVVHGQTLNCPDDIFIYHMWDLLIQIIFSCLWFGTCLCRKTI